MSTLYNCSEGHQRELGDFEMLQAEGDAHDGEAEETAQHGGFYRQGQAGYDEPDQVQEKGSGPASVTDFLPEGEEAESGEFKALYAHGNPDDGNTPQKAGCRPAHSADKPSKDKP